MVALADKLTVGSLLSGQAERYFSRQPDIKRWFTGVVWSTISPHHEAKSETTPLEVCALSVLVVGIHECERMTMAAIWVCLVDFCCASQ
jgi:hypothetical protein